MCLEDDSSFAILSDDHLLYYLSKPLGGTLLLLACTTGLLPLVLLWLKYLYLAAISLTSLSEHLGLTCACYWLAANKWFIMDKIPNYGFYRPALCSMWDWKSLSQHRGTNWNSPQRWITKKNHFYILKFILYVSVSVVVVCFLELLVFVVIIFLFKSSWSYVVCVFFLKRDFGK